MERGEERREERNAGGFKYEQRRRRERHKGRAQRKYWITQPHSDHKKVSRGSPGRADLIRSETKGDKGS